MGHWVFQKMKNLNGVFVISSPPIIPLQELMIFGDRLSTDDTERKLLVQ